MRGFLNKLSLFLLITGTAGAVPLPSSIIAVQDSPSPNHPDRPYISRKTLTSSERGASVNFEVVLKMRAFSDLQARISSGEQVSPADMKASYEPNASDYAHVVTWLQQQGFTVFRQDSHHMSIFARGTVSQVATAFQTQFAKVSRDNEEYSSAITAPVVPADVASLIVGINGLQPQLHLHSHAVRATAAAVTASATGDYSPADIKQAYGFSGISQTGLNQTIAVVTQTFPASSDLTLFFSNENTSGSIANIQFVQVGSGQLPAATGEETIDVEWSSALAPSAIIRDYATQGLDDASFDQAFQQIYEDSGTHPGMKQVSVSYGDGELYETQAGAQSETQYFAELASVGITVFASSGDGGSTPSVEGHSNTGQLQAEYPASDVNVTGVGGTTLSSVTSSGVSETAWSDGGGGVSAFFSRPSWQTGPGVPSGNMRLVPDVSLNADPETGYVVWYQSESVIYGGTSVSSPVWAGFCALINEARASAGQASLGVLGPHIYSLNGTSAFRDITTGSNGSPNYNAGSGYDLCTGIGVPNVNALLGYLTLPADPFGGTALGGGWNHSSWFGNYNNTYYPWIYRSDLGFIYCSPHSSTDIYLWVQNGNLGWLYTTPSQFSNVYSFSKNSWMWYEAGGTYFYNYNNSAWETY